jgi:hypothetical protein
VIKLPRSLSKLDDKQIGHAKRERDERMSILFRGWPYVNELEMTELRKLSDERQRLARHSRFHALRASNVRSRNTTSRTPQRAGAKEE